MIKVGSIILKIFVIFSFSDMLRIVPLSAVNILGSSELVNLEATYMQGSPAAMQPRAIISKIFSFMRIWLFLLFICVCRNFPEDFRIFRDDYLGRHDLTYLFHNNKAYKPFPNHLL